MEEPEGPGYLQTSVYFNAEDVRMLEELQEETGLKRSPLVRLALQRMYHGEDRERQARLLAIAEELRQLA